MVHLRIRVHKSSSELLQLPKKDFIFTWMVWRGWDTHSNANKQYNRCDSFMCTLLPRLCEPVFLWHDACVAHFLPGFIHDPNLLWFCEMGSTTFNGITYGLISTLFA